MNGTHGKGAETQGVFQQFLKALGPGMLLRLLLLLLLLRRLDGRVTVLLIILILLVMLLLLLEMLLRMLLDGRDVDHLRNGMNDASYSHDLSRSRGPHVKESKNATAITGTRTLTTGGRRVI